MAAAARVVALLRGVNVGTAQRISSQQLRSVVEACGVTGVTTLLNSGNAVGTTGLAPAALAAAVADGVEAECGFRCDVIVRSRAQLQRAYERDPLRDVAADPSRHLLVCLGSKPSRASMEALAARDVTPDQWTLDGIDLHAWMPDGVSQSRLQKALASGALEVPWTGRNWTTVARILNAM